MSNIRMNTCYKKILLSLHCKYCALIRSYSENAPKKKSYKDTILLPKTNFPSRHPADKRNQIEKDIQKTAQFDKLYKWQRQNLKGPEYILHDGPPYANGSLHIGHAVNKIIKDITNRHKILNGTKVNYKPGWDCHGLPIELKALAASKRSRDADACPDSELDPLTVRDIARKFAKETSFQQLETFKSWGIVGDWDNAYYTYSKDYIINQLRVFYELYEKGYVYRALKPVYWSPSTRTALAEAELDYVANYKSTQVYVAFPLTQVPTELQEHSKGKTINAVIWTTTPWTLAVNRAICYNASLDYCLLKCPERPNELFIACKDTVDHFSKDAGLDVESICEFQGSLLSCARYTNPLWGSESSVEQPLLPARHVVAANTGLVHTAPAHGPDDFVVATENGIHVDCFVDEKGCYSGLCGWLDGKEVLKEGQEEVINRLGRYILHKSAYTHSYPCDWRSGKPVILRASQQWFIRTDVLKERALKCLESVDLLPTASASRNRAGFEGQISRRPYWCISRQRCWGVPIPALYKGEEAIVLPSVIDNLCSLIEERGSDVWWQCSVEDLLPTECGLNPREVTKGKDIMDIWMDSGVSWSYAIPDGQTSDLYCEGVDQLTGWFQSSLLTSVALRDKAPYKSIFVHGFVVDENGRKMSKSLGNVIDPSTVIEGGKNRKKEPAYGVDSLRWWVASHATQHSQITLSENLINECLAEITRFRNTYKFLLGNISDIKMDAFHTEHKLSLIDRYMLSELAAFDRQNATFYSELKYNAVAKNILNFVSNQVSGVYCHIVKDRLYCQAVSDDSRVSCQMVLHTVLVSLLRSMGPIVPHLVEEVWSYHPGNDGRPFFQCLDIPLLSSDDGNYDIVDLLIDIKRYLTKQYSKIEELDVVILVKSDVYRRLSSQATTDDVCDILQVSSLKICQDDCLTDEWKAEFNVTSKSQCDRCRRFKVVDDSDNCERCTNLLNVLI